MKPFLSPAAKVQALQRCSPFAAIPDHTACLLAEIAEVEEFRASSVLVEVGESPDWVYVIVQGGAEVIVPGRADPVASLGPGDMFGEYGSLAGQRRTATVRATEPLVALSLPAARFHAFLLERPEAMLEVLRTAVKRLTAVQNRE